MLNLGTCVRPLPKMLYYKSSINLGMNNAVVVTIFLIKHELDLKPCHSPQKLQRHFKIHLKSSQNTAFFLHQPENFSLFPIDRHVGAPSTTSKFVYFLFGLPQLDQIEARVPALLNSKKFNIVKSTPLHSLFCIEFLQSIVFEFEKGRCVGRNV